MRSIAPADGFGSSTSSKNPRNDGADHAGGNPSRLSRSQTSTACTCIGVAVSSTSPPGALLQPLHQAQQGVGAAFLGASGGPPPRMVRLVQHDQVPRLGVFQKGRGAVAAPHQVARRDDHRLPVPVVVAHLALVGSRPSAGEGCHASLPPS